MLDLGIVGKVHQDAAQRSEILGHVGPHTLKLQGLELVSRVRLELILGHRFEVLGLQRSVISTTKPKLLIGVALGLNTSLELLCNFEVHVFDSFNYLSLRRGLSLPQLCQLRVLNSLSSTKDILNTIPFDHQSLCELTHHLLGQKVFLLVKLCLDALRDDLDLGHLDKDLSLQSCQVGLSCQDRSHRLVSLDTLKTDRPLEEGVFAGLLLALKLVMSERVDRSGVSTRGWLSGR